jgi:hypothetical protein
MNPGHKQKKSQEPDAPQWYIDAYRDSLTYGIGVMIFHRGEVKHIPAEKFLELADALQRAHKTIMEEQS